jgi:tRNA G18 (ribose-2'-O)-methylase SpoU
MKDPIRIESFTDNRLAEYRIVSDPTLVHARRLFVAEGRLVVRRVLEDRRYSVKSLLLNDAAWGALGPLIHHLPDDVPVYVCAIDLFRAITGFNIHRGCLALVEPPVALAWREIVLGRKLIVALEEMTNPDNIGGIFRNAAAFGAQAVLLTPGCSDPLYRKAIRTSMGATLRVPFARVEPWPDAIAELRAEGFVTAAMTPRGPSITLNEFLARPPRRIAFILGTEGAGLSSAAEATADFSVRIPICEGVDSLNASVAAGIALHAASTHAFTTG